MKNQTRNPNDRLSEPAIGSDARPGGDGHEGAGGPRDRPFDLGERTAQFGEATVRFAKRVPSNPVTLVLITQLVRAGTSVGANYAEADDAESKKDFRHKIGICRKESRECKHWLRMIAVAAPDLRSEAATLWQEAKELNLNFGSIRRRSS